MRWLFLLDAWLIDKLEGFCHWTQRWIGWGSRKWARTTLIPVMVDVIWTMLSHNWWLIRVALGFYVLFLLLLCYVMVERDQEEEMRHEYGLANERKITMRGTRLYYIVASIVFVPFLGFGSYVMWLYALFFYFIALDDLPKSKSRLRELLESFRRSNTPVTQE